jgi:hypothetical protein
MTEVVDIKRYKNKAYLELCLDLIEDACDSLNAKHYDLVGSQLQDILETFDRVKLKKESCIHMGNVVSFGDKQKIK